MAKIPQGFAGHNLIGVDEAKPSCGHIPGFSEIEELFTLPTIDGNLTPLSAMLFILTTLILRTILDSEFCRVACRILGKPSMFRQ